MRNKKIYSSWLIILPAFVVAFLTSCESEQRPEPIVPDLPSEISFSNHILPIFNGTSVGIDETGRGTACIKCHNGGTPPDLTSENAYIELTAGGYINTDSPEDSRIYMAIKPGGSMNQHTNEVDVAYILGWIQQGAQEN
jgi:hypothetical protein